ncbi:MAG: hypothetical protein KDC54_05280 [Lewinella sp.]|nr:hypothetical protein [Lewinella sp.]
MQRLFLLFAVLSLAACGNNDTVLNGTYLPGTPFNLPFADTASCNGCDGPVLNFSQVVTDSRCPSQVVCVWEGAVTVELEANGETIQLTRSANAGANAPLDTLGNWVIRLIEVNPYPEQAGSILDEDYSLELEVTQL